MALPSYVWTGSAWELIGQEPVVSPNSYQSTAPSSPSTGDIWYNSTTGIPSIWDGSAWVVLTEASKNLSVITAKTGAYTLANGDQHDLIELNGTFTVTVPADATYDFLIGTQINILNIGTGVITTAGAAGVTLTGNPGLKLNGQWSGATFVKRAANTWVIVGDLIA